MLVVDFISKADVVPSNFCGIKVEDMDLNLVEATLASIQTRSLTPIIKEELKLKIQSSRLAAGKQELPKPIFKEPEKFKLTEEEEQRREIRRDCNRKAAEKCRRKKKTQIEGVKTTKSELELKNFSLKKKIEDLEREKADVIKRLKLQNIDIPTALFPSSHAVPVILPLCDINSSLQSTYNQSVSYKPVKSNTRAIYSTEIPSTSSLPFRRYSTETVPPSYPYKSKSSTLPPPRRYSADIPHTVSQNDFNNGLGVSAGTIDQADISFIDFLSDDFCGFGDEDSLSANQSESSHDDLMKKDNAPIDKHFYKDSLTADLEGDVIIQQQHSLVKDLFRMTNTSPTCVIPAHSPTFQTVLSTEQNVSLDPLIRGNFENPTSNEEKAQPLWLSYEHDNNTENVDNCIEYNHVELCERFFIPLVVDDEAMVPGSASDPQGAISPTFY